MRPSIEPQSFPDRVAALDRRVERADAGLIPMHQLAVDVDQQIAVFFVEVLEHMSPIGPI